jgi:hypothetical protein
VVKAVELSVPAIAVQVTLSVDSSQRTQRAKVQVHFALERTSKESDMFSHVLRGEPPKEASVGWNVMVGAALNDQFKH